MEGFMQNSNMMWNSPFEGTPASGIDIHNVNTLSDFCMNPSYVPLRPIENFPMCNTWGTYTSVGNCEL